MLLVVVTLLLVLVALVVGLESLVGRGQNLTLPHGDARPCNLHSQQ